MSIIINIIMKITSFWNLIFGKRFCREQLTWKWKLLVWKRKNSAQLLKVEKSLIQILDFKSQSKEYSILDYIIIITTVEPPSRGHFGTSYFVPCSELSSFRKLNCILTPYKSTLLEVSFVERLSLSRRVV